MVSETLELIIRTSGASAAGQQIGSIGAQARASMAAVNGLNESLAFMRKALVALSFIRVFEGIATSISQAQQINNQILQIAKNASDVPKAFDLFEGIALKTHAPLAAVTGLAVQIARSSASYKMGAKDIADATETIFNTFRLNGSDPATISNVTKDLKEIFSLGVVQGRQFRAVILQNQAEALLLAKHLHASGADAVNVNKELDQLRAKGGLPDIYEMAMKHKGAFTGHDVLVANAEGKSDTDARVSQLPKTLAQSFTDLQTKWLSLLNTMNNAGAFKPIVDFIEFLADNLPLIVYAVVAFGAAWASWAVLRSVVPMLYGMAQGLLGIAVAGVSGALWMAGYLTAFSVYVATSLAGYAAVGAAATASAAVVATESAVEVAEFAGTTAAIALQASLLFAVISAEVVAALPFIASFVIVFGTLGLAVAAAGSALIGFVAPLGQLSGLTAGLHLTLKDLPTLFTALSDTVVSEWPLITKLIGDMWTDMVNGMENRFNDFNGNVARKLTFNMLPESSYAHGTRPTHSATGDIEALNKALLANYAKAKAATGLPEFKPPAPPAPEVDMLRDRANRMREALQSLEDMLARFAGPAKKFQDDIDKFSTKIKNWTTATHDAKGHEIAPLLTNADVAAKFAAAGFDDYNAKTHTSIKLQQDMAREVLGLKNTDMDLAHTQDMVNKALGIQAITQAEATKIIEDATRKRDLYNLSLLHTVDAGIKIAQIEHDYAKARPDAIANATATRAFKFDEASDISTYTLQVQTLNQMLAEQRISNQAYTQSIYEIQRAYLSTATDGISGFQKGLLEVQRTMFDTADDAARVLTDSFKGLQDSLVDFAVTGKLNFHNMATSILRDVDTLIVKQAIMQPLVSALGFGPGSSLGIGQPNGGLGGILGGIFGGGSAGAGGQLGASAAMPMFVSVVPGIGGLLSGAGSGGAAGIFDKGGFFGNLLSGSGGGAGSTSSGILDTLTNVASLFGFATGGDFMVGGQGGTDSQLVAFRASPDERVTVQTPQQQRAAQNAQRSASDMGGLHVHLHGVTDFDSFRKSKGQLAAGIGAISARTLRRNGN